jgi:excisionase family DNA binding protein
MSVPIGTSPFLTTSEVATILRRSVYTIRRRCAEGHYPGARKDGRDWRIPQETILPPRPAASVQPLSPVEHKARRILESLA